MNKRYILLEPTEFRLNHFAHLDAWVCRNRKDIAEVVPHASASSVWISFGSKADHDFLRSVVGKKMPPGRLLALKPPRIEDLSLLAGFFSQLLGVGPTSYLPDEELAEILNLPQEESRNVFIGGAVNTATGAVGLIRGDVKMLVVPLEVFRPNQITKPDPGKLAFTDFGQTVRMGEYEASADSILYEFDPSYRKQVNERRREKELTFGTSLRRLRQQKMLARSDFPPISAKEIARIERGEIVRPHGRTMKIIAHRLGVKEEEIETY